MTILLAMVVYLGMIGIGSFIVKALTPSEHTISYVNIVTVGATGLILIWYTVETQLLRRETQRLIEVQQRPFVVFEVGDFGTSRDPSGQEYRFRFCVRNIGTSAAVNVRVIDVPLEMEDTFIRFPDVITTLPQGTQQRIHEEGVLQGKPMYDWLSGAIDPKYANRPFIVSVEFQNVEMTQYFVKQKVAPGLLEIIDAGRV